MKFINLKRSYQSTKSFLSNFDREPRRVEITNVTDLCMQNEGMWQDHMNMQGVKQKKRSLWERRNQHTSQLQNSEITLELSRATQKQGQMRGGCEYANWRKKKKEKFTRKKKSHTSQTFTKLWSSKTYPEPPKSRTNERRGCKEQQVGVKRAPYWERLDKGRLNSLVQLLPRHFSLDPCNITTKQ